MSPVTALGVGAVAAALWLASTRPAGKFAAALAGIVVLMMLGVLASHFTYHADVISPWIAARLLNFPGDLSGRVSTSTALGLLALAVARMAARYVPRRAAIRTVELTANGALLLGVTALLGYAYRISDLYGLYLFNAMSLQSALAITSLAIGTLLAAPETRLGTALRSPGIGMRQMRWMLVLTVLPMVLGWILLHSGGVLNSANGASMALLATVTGVPMFYLVLENAHTADLLERKRAEQRDIEQKLMRDLQRQLAARTAELAEQHRLEVATIAVAERDKRYTVIAQLTGSIAHDFNNLLMVIGGSAQLLKIRLRGDVASAPLIDKIGTTVGRAAKLTAQLLAFSRTQRLQITPLELDAVVRSAIAEILPQLPPDIKLTVDLHAQDCTVLSDGSQLQLALAHLIRNAWEAMGERGTVGIATVRRQGPTGEHVELLIRDSGCGMNEEMIKSAAEPFFTTKQGNHPGLGLAQVNSVVNQASGTMHIHSGTDRGTTISVCLPCTGRPVDLPVPRTLPLGLPSANKRLLVIDDDEEVRAVVVALLKQMHYEVAEADSGEKGLRLLDQLEPALAIIDYLMPGMNGAEVARQVRLRTPDLPIIFISGYADSNAINAIPRARLLRKPVLAEDLEQTLADALHAG
jgi:signal transduction histidine kinase